MDISRLVDNFAKVTEQEGTSELYKKLIQEEFEEWGDEASVEQAVLRGSYSAEDELKELADLVYVIFGYARVLDWDLNEAVKRVHENNLNRCARTCDECDGYGSLAKHFTVDCPKCDGRGIIVERREDGKIIKDPNYPKVNLKDLVK